MSITYLIAALGFFLAIGPGRKAFYDSEILDASSIVLKQLREDSRECFKDFAGTLIVSLEVQYNTARVSKFESDPKDEKFLRCIDQLPKKFVGVETSAFTRKSEIDDLSLTYGYLQPSQKVWYVVNPALGRTKELRGE